MMFIPIVLVCIAGQSPQECLPPTARIVVTGEAVPNELVCMRDGQMKFAQTAIAQRLNGEYTKVMCLRK